MYESSFDTEIVGIFVQIGGNLDLSAAERLSNLDLTGTHIEGEFRLAYTQDTKPTWQNGALLTLRNVSANALQDTADGWPENLDLDGFAYRSLGVSGLQGTADIADRGSEWFVSWLARDEPYTPQPYEQLASVLRRMGHREEANDVLYAGRERARALALANGHYWSWAGQSALKYTIGYGFGHRYFRSLYRVLGLVFLG